MKNPRPPSSASAVRLPDSLWPKLRCLMQLKGRGWLERCIEREFNKLTPEQKATAGKKDQADP